MGKTILFYGGSMMLLFWIFFNRLAETGGVDHFATVFVDASNRNADNALIDAAVGVQVVVLQINPEGLPSAETLVLLAPLLLHRTLVRIPLFVRCLCPFMDEGRVMDEGRERAVGAASRGTLGESGYAKSPRPQTKSKTCQFYTEQRPVHLSRLG